ncbi:hypothetical protein [Fimbriiglobus ruber]|uniref:Carboxypeptidase regulatory-like domain-containing protein n=1 Tax=Fimbriiglobus ruber TaxID=1908690 RepID=A0A225DV61_9BACT|nr:hypothetical protein [Fimbriiglobus ruber]OWK45241.1 hypothetical protein FRUB_01572 [Fimbriiglobus ruber]
MRSRLLSVVWWAGAATFLLTQTGCSPGHGDLRGQVTYKGKPLRMGSLSAVGADGIPKSAAIQPDGSYAVQNLPAGLVKLTVCSPDPAKMQPRANKARPGEPPPKIDATGWVAIPDKYCDFSTSELTFTLGSGANEFNVELK